MVSFEQTKVSFEQTMVSFEQTTVSIAQTTVAYLLCNPPCKQGKQPNGIIFSQRVTVLDTYELLS
jgi:hypothetical protein